MKNRKLFASFAIAAGMVVSAIISQGNIVEAATAPTMLGAEILKDTTGSVDQSLRIGMTVSYQGATDFGMYLVKKSVLGSAEPTLAKAIELYDKNKAVKVSYAAGQTQIIDINTESKTLTYGVELTGVTKDYYETEVVAIGYVQDAEDTKDANITRNVMDVAVASGQFGVKLDGSLVFGMEEEVDLSKMSVVEKKSSTKAATDTTEAVVYEPSIEYNENTGCWDLNNIVTDAYWDKGQNVTFNLGNTYDLNNYDKIVIRYKGDQGNKATQVDLIGENERVTYCKENIAPNDQQGRDTLNFEKVEGDMTWWGASWANGNIVTLDISKGVPCADNDNDVSTQAYKKDMTISKIKLAWPMAWNEKDGVVTPYNWGIEKIYFVKKGVKSIERTLDLSKVVLPTAGTQTKKYDPEKRALKYQNLVYNWYEEFADLKGALTSTFDSQYYSKVRFNIEAVDTKGNRVDNKIRLRMAPGNEYGSYELFTEYANCNLDIKADNEIYTLMLNGKSNGGNGGLRFSLSGSPNYTPTNTDDTIYVSEITFVQ